MDHRQDQYRTDQIRSQCRDRRIYRCRDRRTEEYDGHQDRLMTMEDQEHRLLQFRHRTRLRQYGH